MFHAIDRETMLLIVNDGNGGYPFQVSDGLLEDVRAVYTVSEEDRVELVTGILEQMAVECQWVPLYDTPMYSVYNARVGNYYECSAGTYVFYFGNMTINE